MVRAPEPIPGPDRVKLLALVEEFFHILAISPFMLDQRRDPALGPLVAIGVVSGSGGCSYCSGPAPTNRVVVRAQVRIPMVSSTRAVMVGVAWSAGCMKKAHTGRSAVSPVPAAR